MQVGKLMLPSELVWLIESGWWPTQANAKYQNGAGLVAPEQVQRVSREDRRIYFLPPPFQRVAEAMDRHPSFWLSPAVALRQIDPYRAIDIGDFGIGSDSPILLDFRQDMAQPAVLYLHYDAHRTTRWLKCADSFLEFMQRLQLPLPLSLPEAICQG